MSDRLVLDVIRELAGRIYSAEEFATVVLQLAHLTYSSYQEIYPVVEVLRRERESQVEAFVASLIRQGRNER